jgi:hypothetical protein
MDGMWHKANVSKKSQRRIIRYLAAEYGGCLVVPEAKVDIHVSPVTGIFEGLVTRKIIYFWTKPIAWLLEVLSIPTCSHVSAHVQLTAKHCSAKRRTDSKQKLAIIARANAHYVINDIDLK